MDFPIIIDPAASEPLWKQLSAELRKAITSKRLDVGSPLPPTRQLAQLLGISRDTVVRAYEELVTQGYAQTKVGAGTIVRYNISDEEGGLTQAEIAEAGRPPKAVHFSDYAKRVLEIESAQSTSADLPTLNFGAPPQDQLPVKQWRDILMHHAALQDPSQLSGDEETFGLRPLREAIASHLRRSKALNCRAEQVIVCSDSQVALDLIGRIFLNAGDGVIVENPGYCGAREHFLSLGAQLCPISVDEDGLMTNGLETYSGRCKLAYVSPFHHDPTGVVMPEARRQELLSWAGRNNVLIAEDAFDSDYRYGSQPELPLQASDNSGNVVYIYSFWKMLYPITTIGCLIVPPDLIEVFTKAKLLTRRNYSLLEHYVLCDFLTQGHLERHIRKTRAIYAKRRQNLIYMLTQSFGNEVYFHKESAGLHLLVRFTSGLEDQEIQSCAQQAGLPLASTRPFYVEDPVAAEFLIPFAGIDEEVGSRAISKMADLMSDLRKKAHR